jgi:hypothetical protein
MSSQETVYQQVSESVVGMSNEYESERGGETRQCTHSSGVGSKYSAGTVDEYSG